MSDPRRTPVNSRVAAAHLAVRKPGVVPVTGYPRQVVVSVADLLLRPGGLRVRQLIWGDEVQVYETRNGVSFVQAKKDGYVGYVPESALASGEPATHWVRTAGTHAYSAPDFKAPELRGLSLGSRLRATDISGRFVQTSHGFVPNAHLADLNAPVSDPVDVAELLLGTPYLWGGNSRWGIDCSGLVQAAFLACGCDCPGASDQQEAELGVVLPDGTPPERGDLLFWNGHVAIVRDKDTLLHANVHHMAVALEPLVAAIERIAAQGDGPVTTHKRVLI